MRKIFAFVQRDVRLALSYPSSLTMPFASILFTVGGFSILARIVSPHATLESGRHLDYFTYVVVNLTFMVVINTAVSAVSAAIRRDQTCGTLEPIVATPTSLVEIVLASAAWPLVFAALQALVYFACGFLFGMRIGSVNVPLLVEFLILGVACGASLGAIASAFVIAFKQPAPLNVVMGSAVTFLTGVLFPVSLLPYPLQIVSWLLPLTHALRGLRAAISGSAFATGAGDAWWLAVATLLLFPTALLALHIAIVRAKTDGSLSAY